jgi:hypothetical protein
MTVKRISWNITKISLLQCVYRDQTTK